jgi:hypothetical protein
MTFTRSQVLRTLLIGVVVIFGVALTYRRWIRPVETQRAANMQRIDKVRDQLRSAEREMMAIKNREQDGSEIRKTLSSLHENLPATPPVVWLPDHLKTTLARLGVVNVNVRLNKAAPEPLLVGFERVYWFVSVPTQTEARILTHVLLAVSQIEQQSNFVRIESLSFHLDDHEQKGASGYVNLTSFVPKT